MILMDFRIGLFSALLLLASCGTNKKCCDAANAIVKETTIKDTVVKESKMFLGTIQLHRPFCGGMRPNSEQEKGFIEAVSNADFYLYQGEIPTNQSEFIKFTTNDLGKFTLDLAPGKYNIIQANKLLSLERSCLFSSLSVLLKFIYLLKRILVPLTFPFASS